ncbi:MAG TPA: hypothetical protein VKE41_11155 [Roseiflexaceae bacterium]|nr:hypothetical protein [Roseiflexaceae bacterium]
MPSDTAILDNIDDEARRIVTAAQARGVLLRLLGGLAVRLRSPSASHRALARGYPDIDFVTVSRGSRAVEALLTELGYEPNKEFNLLNGSSRLLFYDPERERQIDVFVGQFEMCHRLPIGERLDRDQLTVPLAELLLTKLQIVQLNEKDVRDVCALLLDHPLGEGDGEAINLARIAQLCAEDWGLWKTVTISLQKVQDFCDAYDLEAASKLTIVERVGILRQALDSTPKSLKWKLRAKLGERVQWYELPEEVQRG